MTEPSSARHVCMFSGGTSMIRFAGAVAIALCLSPAWLHAQSVQFTVGVPMAGIYQSPSTGSPILAQRPQGTVFEVQRNLGSWIEVTWPAAARGVAYVYASMGSIGEPPPPTRPMTIAEYVGRSSAGPFSPATAADQVPSGVPGMPGTSMPGPISTRQQGGITVAPAHFVGLGARIGSRKE